MYVIGIKLYLVVPLTNSGLNRVRFELSILKRCHVTKRLAVACYFEAASSARRTRTLAKCLR